MDIDNLEEFYEEGRELAASILAELDADTELKEEVQQEPSLGGEMRPVANFVVATVIGDISSMLGRNPIVIALLTPFIDYLLSLAQVCYTIGFRAGKAAAVSEDLDWG